MLADAGFSTNDGLIPPRPENNVEGVVESESISVGVAICWELIRLRTVERLRGKVDIVLAGSAWPTIDPGVGFPGLTRDQILDVNASLSEILAHAPVELARNLGVPVVHANLVGDVTATKLFDQSTKFVTQFAGESRIVDANGNVLARRDRSEGEGIVVADVPLERHNVPTAESEGLWLTELPASLQNLWYQGSLGRNYYLAVTVPIRNGSDGEK